MRQFAFIVLTVLLSQNSLANDGPGPVRAIGIIGIAPSINAADLNSYIDSSGVGSDAKLTRGDIFNGMGFGFIPGLRWELYLSYEMHKASGYKSTGFQVQQDMIWIGPRYHFVHFETFELYFGLLGGYPTTSHVTANFATKREYDAEKRPCFQATVGALHAVTPHFLVILEVGYQAMAQGILKDSAGSSLQVGTTQATLDLSGARILAATGFSF